MKDKQFSKIETILIEIDYKIEGAQGSKIEELLLIILNFNKNLNKELKDKQFSKIETILIEIDYKIEVAQGLINNSYMTKILEKNLIAKF